jgi:hypothetical protein
LVGHSDFDICFQQFPPAANSRKISGATKSGFANPPPPHY